MDIIAFAVFDGNEETGPVPPRFEMVVSQDNGFSNITPTSRRATSRWTFEEWGEHGITFYSGSERCMVDKKDVGSRYGFDLLGVYGASAAADYLAQAEIIPADHRAQRRQDREGWYELSEAGSDSAKGGPNWEQGGSNSEGGSIPWEGRLNASGILPSPVYPVTVFTPNDFVSMDIFFPVIYLWELMDIYRLHEWKLGVSEICALHGEVVFQLNKRGA